MKEQIQSFTNSSMEETDLHIVSHLDEAQLPLTMREMLSEAHSDAEKDILLMALLAAMGSCMPNVCFRYGITGKKYYPNLQCFVVGNAACGKGIANLALDMVRPIDEAMPLVISGDATYAAFFRQLAKQDGRGYIHESEGSVITDIWKTSAVNYNTALRKAAEHEPVSRARMRTEEVIRCPQVSMLLTGTWGQYKALVPSIENGYFSRLLTLVVKDRQAFSSRYVVRREPEKNTVVTKVADRMYTIYEQLLCSHEKEFALTSDQRIRLGQHLENAYPMLIKMLGENFHSVVLRMAVHIQRIALILTVLRQAQEGRLDCNLLYCSPEDYQTAELIGNKLILHMAQAYQLLRGKEQDTLPPVTMPDQKKLLLSLLPKEYATKNLVSEAQSQGICERTAKRWNDSWIMSGEVEKIRYGFYRKLNIA